MSEEIIGSTIERENLPQAGFTVNPDSTQQIRFSLLEGTNLSDFHTLRFLVKAGNPELLNRFRIKFFYETNGEEYVFISPVMKEVDKEVRELEDGWVEFRINLSSLRNTIDESITWEDIKDKVTNILFVTESRDFEGLNRRDKRRLKTYLSFKDILFIPEDEKNLLGLGDIAVILKTALLGADYDLGKRRDFNLMRYVQERLGVTSEQNVLNQFEEWAQFSLKADNLRLTLSEKEREFLSRSAKGNFEFFNSSGIDQRSGLPFDYVIAKDPSPVYGRYTKISNIGMALASYVAGYEMGLISKQEVVAKISKVFDTLDNVEVYEVPEGPLKGKKFLYEGYELDKRNEEGKLLPILNRSISSIDTAWFLVGLILVKEVFKDVDEIAVRANYWLENNDLRLFYDETRHLFRVLYRYYPDRDELVDEYPDARYTVFSSETRILSYLALGLGVVNEEEFRRHWQTLSKPKSSDLGTEYEGIDLVLSWAGGAFEFGMPALFVDEAKLFPQGQGINLYKAMVLQKLWVENNGYPVFGESPSTDENYHYDIFGAPPAGMIPGKSRGVIAPHASFLFPFGPAVRNLRIISILYPDSYSPDYGFASAIDTRTGEVIKLYRPLEQGMIMTALANILCDDIIHKMFLSGVNGDKIIRFLKNEAPFFNPFEIAKEMTVLFEKGIKHLGREEWRQANTIFEYMDFLDKTYGLNFDYQNWREKYRQAKEMAEENLATLYSQAQQELNARNYNLALKYLAEIISFDPDYCDCVKLYQQTYRILYPQQER